MQQTINDQVLLLTSDEKVVPGNEDPQYYLDDSNNDQRNYQGLIMLTEGSRFNLRNFTSNQYYRVGNQKIAKFSGIHSAEVWETIIFMCLAALCTLEKHNIVIPNVKCENVMIVDLLSQGRANGYWVYVIDEVPYYIPNLGYMAKLDLNSRDIEMSQSAPTRKILENAAEAKRAGKPYLEKEKLTTSKLFKAYQSSGLLDFNDDVEFVEALNNETDMTGINSLLSDLMSMKDNLPAAIQFLIGKIQEDAKEGKTISEILFSRMRKFMHNRIGTQVTVKERISDRGSCSRKFKTRTFSSLVK